MFGILTINLKLMKIYKTKEEIKQKQKEYYQKNKHKIKQNNKRKREWDERQKERDETEQKFYKYGFWLLLTAGVVNLILTQI
jgi:hypothetical protein